MNLIQLLGIVIIVDVLIWGIWLVATDKFSGSSFGLATLGIGAGVVLFFNARVTEAKFTKDGVTMQLAIEKAVADAKEVEAIRARVESQAATIDLVAKNSADALKVVEKIRDDAKKAEEKLAIIEEKTADTHRLPDGRYRNGATITGSPKILLDLYEKMRTAHNEGSASEAEQAAEEILRIMEETENVIGKNSFSIDASAHISKDGLIVIYTLAAGAAARRKDHALAVERYHFVYKARPREARIAFNYIVYLLAAGKKDEAERLAQNAALDHGEDFRIALHNLLAANGLLNSGR